MDLESELQRLVSDEAPQATFGDERGSEWSPVPYGRPAAEPGDEPLTFGDRSEQPG